MFCCGLCVTKCCLCYPLPWWLKNVTEQYKTTLPTPKRVHRSITVLRRRALHLSALKEVCNLRHSSGLCFEDLSPAWSRWTMLKGHIQQLHAFAATPRDANKCLFVGSYWQTENTFQCMHLPTYSIVQRRTQIHAASHVRMHAAYKLYCSLRNTHTHYKDFHAAYFY